MGCTVAPRAQTSDSHSCQNEEWLSSPSLARPLARPDMHTRTGLDKPTNVFAPGQLGRVAVIGGSQDYTGAPYFSAMASARLGCDMVGQTNSQQTSWTSAFCYFPSFGFKEGISLTWRWKHSPMSSVRHPPRPSSRHTRQISWSIL